MSAAPVTASASASSTTAAIALDVLCAGAVQGVVKALQQRFEAETGIAVRGTFGAVGTMREALLARAPCDLFIVTAAMVDALLADGTLLAGSAGALGSVRTGIAVRHRSAPPGNGAEAIALPDIATEDALRAALLAADAVYFPDAERSTAGIHFAGVLRGLGIADALGPRLRTFPNGATAMRALGDDATSTNPIGCTQVTEINYTPGVRLVGVLPRQFELATVYTAAVPARAANAEHAARFIQLLTGAASQPLRAAGGFEF